MVIIDPTCFIASIMEEAITVLSIMKTAAAALGWAWSYVMDKSLCYKR
jgi:hypothetical protein